MSRVRFSVKCKNFLLISVLWKELFYLYFIDLGIMYNVRFFTYRQIFFPEKGDVFRPYIVKLPCSEWRVLSYCERKVTAFPADVKNRIHQCSSVTSCYRLVRVVAPINDALWRSQWRMRGCHRQSSLWEMHLGATPCGKVALV